MARTRRRTSATAAAASAPTVSFTAEAETRDIVTEKAALSLAQRRERCAPSIDTKLANAWLGFYVALTKTSSRPAEAATQASTEAVTEPSLSDDESETEFSARLAGEPWADGSEEQPEKKRTRRSHRRRRTRRRGRGGKGRREVADVNADEDFTPTDDESDCCLSLRRCLSQREAVSPAIPAPRPLQATQASRACPVAFLHTAVSPMSPSTPCRGPTGMLASTSPNEGCAQTQCEASTRSPPTRLFMPVSTLPLAPMRAPMVAATNLAMQIGGPAAVQGNPVFMMPMQPPQVVLMPPQVAAAATPNASVLRLWLAGGMPTSDAELMLRLQEAAPEAYED